MLRVKHESLARTQRIFLGEELNALGIKDLQSIEKQLERTLAQARKHQMEKMMAKVDELRVEVDKVEEVNKQLKSQRRGISTYICDNTNDSTISSNNDIITNLLDPQANQFDYGTTRTTFKSEKRRLKANPVFNSKTLILDSLIVGFYSKWKSKFATPKANFSPFGSSKQGMRREFGEFRFLGIQCEKQNLFMNGEKLVSGVVNLSLKMEE
ncbi:hypothetical protein TSUD_45300 [Trifolium subterraneum]|nr:hypothetical protein TSUD_45300 [Trifolium subterraneum]